MLGYENNHHTLIVHPAKWRTLFPCVSLEDNERTFIREFTGNLTECRRELLESYCKALSWHYNCGHEYDCCGCVCSQRASFTYSAGQVVVTIKTYENY